jgi:hypothetical protein
MWQVGLVQLDLGSSRLWTSSNIAFIGILVNNDCPPFGMTLLCRVATTIVISDFRAKSHREVLVDHHRILEIAIYRQLSRSAVYRPLLLSLETQQRQGVCQVNLV